MYDREPTDPTEDQIRQRAAEVRRGWSKKVRQRRSMNDESGWKPPLVQIVDIVEEANSHSNNA